jgi:hypothetical protein
MPVHRSLKYKERLELARRIEIIGTEMLVCSHCERTDRKCVVSEEDSSHCSECIRCGRKCDVQGPSLGDWASLEREEKCLQQEEEEAMGKIL